MTHYLLSAVVFTTLLCACQDQTPPQTTSTNQAELPQEQHVALICDNGFAIKATYSAPDADGLLSKLSLEVTKDNHTGTLIMEPAEAASGSKFETADQKTAFWEHQDEFTLYQEGNPVSVCELPTKTQEITSTSGKSFIITEENSDSLTKSKINITPRGFPASVAAIELNNSAPLSDSFVADLNHDGFDELYIVTQTAGEGNFANIQGFASIKDQSLTPIKLTGITDKDTMPGGIFEGYRGSDSFYVDENSLKRDFPIYQQKNAEPEPSGGTRRLTYELKTGGDTWLLSVVKAETVQ